MQKDNMQFNDVSAKNSNTNKVKHNSSQNRNRNNTNKKSYKIYLIGGIVCFVLLVAYIITAILHPVGVMEYLKSIYYNIGTGKGYDVELTGGKPIYTIGDSSRYYVVSSSSVDCFNKNGKTIFKRSHSFTKPVIKTAETRYLLYGQGERVLYVSTLADNLYTVNLQNGITTADISDSGVFAVASKSEGYSSSVTVYSKKNEKIFEWFSPDEVINYIELSKNGNLLAVSTLKVADGKYISSVYILNFKSADQIYKKVYSDDVIYQIIATNSSTFCTVLSDNIEFINYKKDQVSSFKSDYSVNIVKFIDDKVITARSVAANQDESIIEVYKKNGERICSFNVDDHITDFSYKSNRLFLLGVHDVYKYNTDGEFLATIKADYDLLFVEAISSNNLALIKNSSITKSSITNPEEQ